MNKRILSVLFAMLLVFQGTVFADNSKSDAKKEDGTYDVPVYLKHFDKDRESMGNPALRKIARVKVENGEATYKIYASMMPFGNAEGGVEKLYIYNTNDKKAVPAISKTDFTKDTVTASKENADIEEMNSITTNKIVTDEKTGEKSKKKVTKDYPFVDSYTFKKEAGAKEVYVAVFVPAMGTEQKGILVFDWDKAKKVEEKQANPATDKKLKVKDVSEKHWAYTAVNFVMQKGYFKGGSDGNFMPNDAITGGQFLTVLGRIADVNVNDYKESEDEIYYAPYVKWAKENKLYHIESENFMPNKALTREEMAYIMDKFIVLTDKKLEEVVFTGFNDEDIISSWALDSVKAIAKKGVIKGSDGKFNPKDSFTRAEVAQVLFNIYK